MTSSSLFCHTLLICMLISISPTLTATTFLLPKSSEDSLIQNPRATDKQVTANKDEDLLDIARRFDLGQNEIIRLNPKVDRWLPSTGAAIQLQNSRLLPAAPYVGLVLNLPEFRLYYFPKSENNIPSSVITHPISIGRQDWDTPLGLTKIIAKKENPTWIPPESIKKEHEEKGDPLPDIVPAGPNNPLGLYAIRLGIPGYLIHSTNKPFGVGMRVSHGCIRMYPEDISALFPLLTINTPVTIVNQTVKVGWFKNSLYIEVHPSLEYQNADDLLDVALDLIIRSNNNELPVVKGRKLRRALTEKQGIPVKIFTKSTLFSMEHD